MRSNLGIALPWEKFVYKDIGHDGECEMGTEDEANDRRFHIQIIKHVIVVNTFKETFKNILSI